MAAATFQPMRIDSSLLLKPIAEIHAAPLLRLVNENRAHLRKWLPWVDGMQTEENFLGYIGHCKKQLAAGTDYGYVILLNGEVAGRIGIHQVDVKNKSGMIGYWIGEAFSGRGIITQSCKAVLNFCFAQLGLNRIEIKCAVGNAKSAAIPVRLGFQKEGLLRQAELVNGEFLDLEVYSLLKEERAALHTSAAL